VKRSTLRRELLLNGIVQITFLPIHVVMLTTAGLLPKRDDVFFTLALGPPVLVWTFLLFRCLAIMSTLKSRNYEWIRVPSAFQLYIALGSRAHRIPSRDQLATLPGHKEGDIESIIDLMERPDPRR
jgi:hypothetical protein